MDSATPPPSSSSLGAPPAPELPTVHKDFLDSTAFLAEEHEVPVQTTMRLPCLDYLRRAHSTLETGVALKASTELSVPLFMARLLAAGGACRLAAAPAAFARQRHVAASVDAAHRGVGQYSQVYYEAGEKWALFADDPSLFRSLATIADDRRWHALKLTYGYARGAGVRGEGRFLSSLTLCERQFIVDARKLRSNVRAARSTAARAASARAVGKASALGGRRLRVM